MKSDPKADPHNETMIDRSKYVANLTKGSLKVAETRMVAQLLLDGHSPSEVQAMAIRDNLLQKRSPEATRTLASHLVWRLSESPDCLKRLIAEGTSREATQACLASLVLSSALFADYLQDSVAEVRAQRRSHIAPADWPTFLELLEAKDSSVRAWTPPVRSKLRQNIWRVLAESEIVDSTKHLRLQSVRMEESVRNCLADSMLTQVILVLSAGGVD